MDIEKGQKSIEEEIIARHIKKLNLPLKIYHYTTIDTLINILENKELWLCDMLHMNDKNEINYFLDMLFNAVEERPSLSGTIIENLTSKLIELKNQARRILAENLAYIMSFTPNKNDAAQWERYADNGRGCCIEFDTNELLEIIYPSGGTITLHPVYYADDIRKHEHVDILYNYISDGVLENGFSDVQGVLENILMCASAFKHPSFKSENEVRLLAYPGITQKFCFERMRSNIRQVCKISIKNEDTTEKIMTAVMIAPKSNQSQITLKGYLNKKGFNNLADNISKSDCPLL